MVLVLILLLLLVVAIAAFWILRRTRKGRAEVPPLGIVLFLEAPKALNTDVLASIFSRVTGRVIQSITQESARGPRADYTQADDFVFSAPPSFIAKIDGVVFLVNNVSRPYVADSAQMSLGIHELRLRMAIAEHRAWLSVEILHQQAATPDNYRIVGRVLAGLIGPECLALYHPPSGKLVPSRLDDAVVRLQSEDPISAVFGDTTYVPVILVENDDRLRKAEVEARRRFPEFEDAFRIGAATDFSVKALISSGENAEHIWIEVEGITEAKIVGRIGNEPVRLDGLRLGSRIEIEKSQVEDWAFRRGDTPVGMFTVPVIQRIEKDRSEAV